MHIRESPSVLVVGGGPTGLAAGNLLGALGVSTLLVERNPVTSDDAKAISLDEESMRYLQMASLDRAIYPIIVPGTGTRYFGARGQALVHAGAAHSYRYGHPYKNPFAQPDFERVLREGLDRFPHVEQRFGTALVGLRQADDGVSVTLRADGRPDEQVAAGYVLACDGGRSTVRDFLGIDMLGRSFDDVWLVVDTLDDPHDQRFGMHHGDPRRPHVIVPGRDGRCRYEFRLLAGEGLAGQTPPFQLLRDLVGPYRSLDPCHVERAVTYRFHALMAETLRDRRCFLLGDAAHMMPPFAGQGLNSGLRDAANLCWKIAEVLQGRAHDALLDTYETERRPHAQAMIDVSVRLGDVVMTTDRRRALVRDVLVTAAMRTPPGRRYLREMRFRPPSRIEHGALARVGGAGPEHLVGLPLPQPRVLSGRAHELVRLDDVLGQGWATLGIDLAEPDWDSVQAAGLPAGVRVDVALDDRAARDRNGRAAITDADGALSAAVGELRGRLVLVRPDRVVAAVFDAVHAPAVAADLRKVGLEPPATPTVTGARGDAAAASHPGRRP